MGVRCGTSSLFITVRTDILHTNAACYFTDRLSEGFLRTVFKLSPQEFASKMESYALTDVKCLARNGNSRKVEYKSNIRSMLAIGLRELCSQLHMVYYTDIFYRTNYDFKAR